MPVSNKWVAVLLLFQLSLSAAVCTAQDAKIPYRGDYPEINTIGVHDLYAGLECGDFIVVDVRSQLEFDVIHVDGTLHIPVAKGTFAGAVNKVAAENPNKIIAFYRNGTTCLKSYKAARKAQEAGVANVYAFDGGIPEWANVWPQSMML